MVLKILLLVMIFSCAHRESYTEVKTGRVHSSCKDLYGKTLLEILDHSVEKGMSCLSSLKGNGSDKNATGFNKLFKSKVITYACHEEDYFRGTRPIAHASLGERWSKEKYDLYHPFISINPGIKIQAENENAQGESKDFIANLLFHEHFHLLNYKHNVDIEYAYTCEDCCMNAVGTTRELGSKYKELSCRICKTEYESVADLNYLKDYDEWLSYKTVSSLKWDVTIRKAVILSRLNPLVWKYFFKNKDQYDLSYVYLGKLLHTEKVFSQFRKKDSVQSGEAVRTLARSVAQLEHNFLTKQTYVETGRSFLALEMESLKHELRLNKDAKSHHFKTAASLQEAIVADIYLLADEVETTDWELSQNLWTLYYKVLDFSGSR